MKFVSNSHNKLLHRQDIIAKNTYSSNPGFTTVKEDLAKHFKTTADCIVVRAVRGSFGSSDFVIEASIYDSAEKLQSIEPKPKVKKAEGSN